MQGRPSSRLSFPVGPRVGREWARKGTGRRRVSAHDRGRMSLQPEAGHTGL